MRADARRSERALLQAADRVLTHDPSASLDQVAREAGVARSTLHRRFSSRERLLAAMARWTTAEIRSEIDRVLAETSEHDDILQLLTERVLRVKVAWPFTSTVPASVDPEAHRRHDEIVQRCDTALRRARDAGSLAPDTDLTWARQVYYALIETTVQHMTPDDAPHQLAYRLVTTFSHGLAARREPPTPAAAAQPQRAREDPNP
jgi:AcrR family transcriptional regulator